ncbi:MAG: hypothetical protein PF495_12250 [Spirochaetales bacterium]|nr:hypothetical protein [Spirochaetales bacterium]
MGDTLFVALGIGALAERIEMLLRVFMGCHSLGAIGSRVGPLGP